MVTAVEVRMRRVVVLVREFMVARDLLGIFVVVRGGFLSPLTSTILSYRLLGMARRGSVLLVLVVFLLEAAATVTQFGLPANGTNILWQFRMGNPSSSFHAAGLPLGSQLHPVATHGHSFRPCGKCARRGDLRFVANDGPSPSRHRGNGKVW